LVAGIYDYFEKRQLLNQIMVIGPSATGATLEGSKAFAKAFMLRHGIPTAAYREFKAEQFEEACAYLKLQEAPYVLKADGLAAGKGVIIAQSYSEAETELREILLNKRFGAAGNQVVIEQFLNGIEFSVFALTDGSGYCLLPEAKDYKRIGEKDTGLNTGGMGAVSPVPFVTKAPATIFTILPRGVETLLTMPT
jgi:phosphoribosylamine--glycine ligase